MLVLGTHLPKAVFEIKIPLRGIGGTAPNLNFDIFDLVPPSEAFSFIITKISNFDHICESHGPLKGHNLD